MFDLRPSAAVLHKEPFWESQRDSSGVCPRSSSFPPLCLLKHQPKQCWNQRSSRPSTPLWENISDECSPAPAWWVLGVGNAAPRLPPAGRTHQELTPNSRRAAESKLSALCWFCSTPHSNSPPEHKPDVSSLCKMLESWIIPQDPPKSSIPGPGRIKLSLKWALDAQNAILYTRLDPTFFLWFRWRALFYCRILGFRKEVFTKTVLAGKGSDIWEWKEQSGPSRLSWCAAAHTAGFSLDSHSLQLGFNIQCQAQNWIESPPVKGKSVQSLTINYSNPTNTLFHKSYL